MDSGAKQLAGRWAVRRTAGGECLEQQDGAARGGSHVAISGAQAGLTDVAWEEFFCFAFIDGRSFNVEQRNGGRHGLHGS